MNRCEECGNEFELTRPDRRFCCSACGNLYRSRIAYRRQHPLQVLTCAGCGEQFLQRNTVQVYCTKKCGKKKRNRERYTKTKSISNH